MTFCEIIMDTGTLLYGLIGDPVSHSLGPLIHNRAFAEIGHNGVYLAFRVTDLPAAVDGVRAMGIRGVSVTIPHKVAVMDLLDTVDPAARAIGAVNTLVNRNGRIEGFNTDGAGAVAALAEKTAIRGKTVWMIGAGGAARAVGFGVGAEGGRLTVVNRSRQKGERLAAELDAGFRPLADIRRLDCDILINATAVGMTPDTGGIPVAPEAIAPGTVVMDIVYNPINTRLLDTARAKGCTIVDGAAMFVHQAAAQFQLWTGRTAPIDVMDRTVRAALGEKP